MGANFIPAAESAATTTTAAPAATFNAAPATEQKEPQTNPTSRRRAPSAPIWSALTVARRMFNNLPSALQNTETKRMCLKEAAERTYGDPKPIGSGPYMYSEDETYLVASPYYPDYENLPIDTVFLVKYTDAASRITAFDDGIIDVVTQQYI